MALYKVRWKNSARKELKKINKETIVKILNAVETLSENPHPSGVKKLSGSKNTYRIRVGDYRIVYNIISKEIVIEIIRIGHRKGIYKLGPKCL